jgi:hypothetical protein
LRTNGSPGVVSVVTWGRGLRSAEFLSRLLGIYWFGGKDGGQVYLFIYLFIYLFFSLSTTCRCPDRNSTVSCFAN